MINPNARQARYSLTRLVGDTIGYHYGEKKWYALTARKRKYIIEDLFNDNNLQERFRLTDEESKEIIKAVQRDEV